MTRADTSSSTEAAWTASDLRGDPHQAADKAQRVRRMFAAISRRYDLNNRLHSFGRDQVWRRKAVALCGIQPTDDVLDVACGTGDLSLAAHQALYDEYRGRKHKLIARSDAAALAGMFPTDASLDPGA